MKRRLLLTASCCLLPFSAVAAVDPGLSAGQIVERNVAARGGPAAWRAVNTMTLTGQLEAGGKTNAQLPFVLRLKRPLKSRLEVTFKEQTALQVYDGKQGWKVRPFLNRNEVEPYSAAEAKAAAQWDELDGALIDHAAKGTRVELAGTDTVEGKDAYKLRLTARSGTQRMLWVDAASFLELRIDGEPRRIDGKIKKVSIYYRDFKTENGIATPRVLETMVEGVKQSRKLFVSRVVVNEPMQDAMFAKPQLTLAAAGR